MVLLISESDPNRELKTSCVVCLSCRLLEVNKTQYNDNNKYDNDNNGDPSH